MKSINLQSLFIELCFLLVLFSSCVARKAALAPNSIPYPEPLPEMQALRFLPANVSSDSIDFGAAFSPDGRSFYFARSQNKRLTIYVARFDNGKWNKAVPAGFNDSAYSQADPAFSPDGKLYFISNRPVSPADTTADYNIWFVSALPGGGWGEKQNAAALNSDSNEFYISFAKNGRVYFSSSRKGGLGEEDIYSSRLVNGSYELPQNLGPAINSAKSEYDPGISPGDDWLVFASSGRPGGFGGADLYYAKRGAAKEWGTAVNFGKGINTATREYCPYFTPDGQYFFFSGESDIKWAGMKFLQNKITANGKQP